MKNLVGARFRKIVPEPCDFEKNAEQCRNVKIGDWIEVRFDDEKVRTLQVQKIQLPILIAGGKGWGMTVDLRKRPVSVLSGTERREDDEA